MPVNNLPSSKPGSHLESLSSDDYVQRLAFPSSDSKVGPNAFELTDDEKEIDPQRISVWEESLTTPKQAHSFLSNKKRKLLIKLNVEGVRNIVVEEADERLLDVVWDHLPEYWDNGTINHNAKPGCSGHCGLTGLRNRDRTVYRQLRKRLAEYANANGFHRVLEDHECSEVENSVGA